MSEPITGAPSPEFRKIVAELKAAYDSRPFYGSITVRAHFAEGNLIRFERERSESVKSSGGR